MIENLQDQLCGAFCRSLEVHPVGDGYAVSTVFNDGAGDKLTFYISPEDDGLRIEDDGDYLSTLIANDIRIDAGSRATMLDAILAEAGAYWDRDTYEMRTETFPAERLPERAMSFLASLLRVRDLALITKERVKSAFRDDVIAAVRLKYGDQVEILEGAAPSLALAEFPADIVVKPHAPAAKTAGLYLVNTNEKLSEALLAWRELMDHPDPTVAMIAVLEEPEMRQISRRKWSRAVNRDLPMAVFRGDERSMVEAVGRRMQLQAA
jgi:hypothetical protein